MGSTCAHDAVWNGVCVACGMNIESATPRTQAEQQANPATTSRQKRAFSAADRKYGEFDISKAQQDQLEREAEQRLLKARKLQLVVDLDETLLNTARQPHVARARELTAAVHMLGSGALRPRDFHELPKHAAHFMKLRPGVDKFLATAATMFELCIFTKGSRSYAEDIVQILDPTYAGRAHVYQSAHVLV